jgi:thiamine-phosphate pyrophosphorylase
MFLPRLYPILDAVFFADANALLAAAEELAAAGATLIQYRNKSGSARVVLEQGRELRRVLTAQSQNPHPVAQGATRVGRPVFAIPALGVQDQNPHSNVAKNAPLEWATRSVWLIMNDRADLCVAADFDGVHVGQDDLSAESVRKIIGADRWLGVSTHNPEQVREADGTSADYLAIGPVFATSSKDRPGPVVGLEGVRRARELTRKPLVAIGGITRANAASVIEAGADSVAVISDLLREPGKSAEEFFRILR